MSPSSHERVEALFAEALMQTPEARLSYLAAECAHEPELHQELASLLAAHDQAEGFLSAPVLPRHIMEAMAPLVETVGPYRLLRALGQGGMGTVFLAERADGQYEQQVALKLMRYGLGAGDFQRRFHAERQILARLQHPHIATLLDGGTTDDGQPYLVMEYIVGTRIDAYCQDRGLSIPERLALFRHVCEAVQFAHQHLIVHRDLKPDNILITDDGTVKLLDFGIAKLLDERSAVGTAGLTTQGLPLLTPEYASPEQIVGGPITTATDVYSLGVVLYELLTGKRPFDRQGNPAWPALLWTICEDEPPRPSQAEPRLRRDLQGELDAITLQALGKEPSTRYDSAHQLAEDVAHYLAGRPVRARQATWRYRCTKFTKRHWVAVSLSGLVVVVLVVGMITTLWQWQRAERHYTEVRALANTIVFELTDTIEAHPRSVPLRKLLLEKGLPYLDALSHTRPDDPALMRELAAAYHKLGTMQGNPFRQNLGETTAALHSYEKSLAIREALLARQPRAAQIMREVAETSLMLSGIYGATGALERAQDFTNRGVSLLEQAMVPGRPALSFGLLRFYTISAHWSNARRDYAEARIALQKALAILLNQLASGPATLPIKALRRLGRIYEEWAEVATHSGQLTEAVRYQRARLDLARLDNPSHLNHTRRLGDAYHGLAVRLAAVGDHQKALDAYQQASRHWRTRASKYPADVRPQRALAAIDAGLATLQVEWAESTDDPEERSRLWQEGCQAYWRSREQLRDLPDPEVGFGARHGWLLSLPQRVERIANRCRDKLAERGSGLH